MIYYILLVIVQVLFGVNFVASKVVVNLWSPLSFASTRFLISGLMIIFFLGIMGRDIRLARKYWLEITKLAFVGFSLSQGLFLYGLSLTTPTNTALISSTIPLFVFLVNIFSGSASFDRQKVIGLTMSFAGVLVLRKIENFSLGDATLWGDACILVACMSLGWMIARSGHFFREVDPMVGSAHMFWLGGAFLLPLMILSDKPFPEGPEAIFYFCLAFSIVGATCLTYLFNNIALKRVDSDIVGLFIFLQPVVAAIVAYFIFDTPISKRTIFSFGMIMAGVLMVVRSRSSARD